jgi:hypothetical protein
MVACTPVLLNQSYTSDARFRCHIERNSDGAAEKLRPLWLLQLITPLHLHFHFVTEATSLHIDLELALPAFIVILTFKSQIVCHGDIVLNCTVKQRNK